MELRQTFLEKHQLKKMSLFIKEFMPFKYKTLQSFVNWDPSANEKNKLEQLRALDNGITINAINQYQKFIWA